MRASTPAPETAWDAEFLKSILTKVGNPKAEPPVEGRSSIPKWDMPGFAAGSHVMTTFGLLPIEVIRPHDPIRTVGGGIRRVRSTNRIPLDRKLLARNPEAQPIRIQAGAFGAGLPENDLLLSPGQVLLPIPAGNLGRRTAVGDIHGRADIARVPMGKVTYFVFEFNEPDSAFVEGLPVYLPVSAED